MIKLNEKSKSVFLYSKDGSKNDAPIKAFEALKAALGDTALTAENFKQFAAGFQEFISSSSVQAAPAADDADPNAENTENTENSGATENTENTENTQNNTENTNTEATNASGAEAASTDNTTNTEGATAQSESTQRLKPSSLLSMKN